MLTGSPLTIRHRAQTPFIEPSDELVIAHLQDGYSIKSVYTDLTRQITRFMCSQRRSVQTGKLPAAKIFRKMSAAVAALHRCDLAETHSELSLIKERMGAQTFVTWMWRLKSKLAPLETAVSRYRKSRPL